MTKLVTDGGKIHKQHTFKADTFTVRFRHAAIATTGDLGEVQLTDKDGGQLVLTYAQAISFAHEILRRCQ
jgi:hypothetical protein